MGWFSEARQHQILRLEPSRGVSAIGNFLVFLFAGAVAAAAIVWVTDVWPADIRRPELTGLSD